MKTYSGQVINISINPLYHQVNIFFPSGKHESPVSTDEMVFNLTEITKISYYDEGNKISVDLADFVLWVLDNKNKSYKTISCKLNYNEENRTDIYNSKIIIVHTAEFERK